MAMQISEERINEAGKVLNDNKQSLAARFRALFLLRNTKHDCSVGWISKCFTDSSALLKHELAYCLGQMQNTTAIPCLLRVLQDKTQEPMVRHEAAEALAAIGDSNNEFGVREVLQFHIDDPIKEVAETSQLALQMIQWKLENGENMLTTQSDFNSIDPTPSMEATNLSITDLSNILTDTKRTLWDRYRAMFALRNMNTDQATKALARGIFCEDSALFRHEIAYVLGQIQSPVAIPELKARLSMKNENGMVRHECAETLGSIGTEECQQLLREFLHDDERVVRESCEIALDIAASV